MYQPNVVLVGDRNVGKSTLIAKCHEVYPTASAGGYFTKEFELPNGPTSIKCYPTSVYVAKSNGGFLLSVFRTNIIDTGGAMRYDNIRPLAYKNADIFIVCFDVTNYTSFQNLSKWVSEVRKYELKTPMILVGTKADLDNERAVGKTEVEDLVNSSRDFLGPYLESSYYDKTTVEKVFCTAVKAAYIEYNAVSKSKKKNREKVQGDMANITTLEPSSYPPEYSKTSSTISMDWQSLYQSSTANDLIIKCSDDPMNVILTHKFVLCLASKAFKKLLCSPTNLTSLSQNKHRSQDIGMSECDFSFIESIQCTECHKDQECTALQLHKLCIVLNRTFKRKTFLCLLNWMYTGSLNYTSRDDLDFKVGVYKAAKLLEIQKICRPAVQSRKELSSINDCVRTAPSLQQHDQEIPLPPPLPPILPSAKQHMQPPPHIHPSVGQHGQEIPLPPPSPPLLPSARQHVSGLPTLPQPLPPILISARQQLSILPPLPPVLLSAGKHDQEIPWPPPLPPILPSTRQQVPIPPPLPPILPSARTLDQEIPWPPPLPPILPSARQQVPISPPLPPPILPSARKQVPIPPPLPPILPSASVLLKPIGNTASLSFHQLHQAMWREGISFSSEFPTDIVLIVEETPVPVHRVVLVARSPVMAAMLEGKFREKHLQQIKLHGVSLEHFSTVLEFLYTDNCSLDHTNVNEIMQLADRFLIASLTHRCEEYAINTLENGTDEQSIAKLVVETYYHSKVYNARTLHKWCLHFMATNYNFFDEHDVNLKVIWQENKDYMEDNKWPPQKHMDTLREYKTKAVSWGTLTPRKNTKTVKCACSIM